MGAKYLSESKEAVTDAAGDCCHYEPIPPVAPRGSVRSVDILPTSGLDLGVSHSNDG